MSIRISSKRPRCNGCRKVVVPAGRIHRQGKAGGTMETRVQATTEEGADSRTLPRESADWFTVSERSYGTGISGRRNRFRLLRDGGFLRIRKGTLRRLDGDRRRRLFPAVEKNADAIVVAPGISCRQQVEHATGRRPLHPAEALVHAL